MEFGSQFYAWVPKTNDQKAGWGPGPPPPPLPPLMFWRDNTVLRFGNQTTIPQPSKPQFRHYTNYILRDVPFGWVLVWRLKAPSGFSEHSAETTGSVKGDEFWDTLNYCQLLIKDSVPQRWTTI
jgi:hypothetical protein